MTEGIQELHRAVETAYGCRAVHAASSSLRESMPPHPVWEGIVESFDLVGHPRAVRCYAWWWNLPGEEHFTTVLELPPVVSPRSALRSALATRG